MPYLPTAQEWFTQSALLLEARPTTTRITTKYSLKPPSTKSRKATKPRKARETGTANTNATATSTTATADSESPAVDAPPQTTRATLTLKTYDPNSGATLKYQTDKAAEVGRLTSSLSRLGRGMSGLPELKDVPMSGVGAAEAAEAGSGVATPVGGEGGVKAAASGQHAGGAQGGKKGKKKGKK